MKPKVPPAGQFVLAMFLCYGVAKYIPDLNFQLTGQYVVAIGCCVLSLVVLIGALFQFWKAKTTIDPLNPGKASQLVTAGIYRVTRNPMYLAMLLLIIGYSIKVGNPLNLLVGTLFIWSMNTFQIRPEEEVLEEKFGDAYRQYRLQTRRWI